MNKIVSWNISVGFLPLNRGPANEFRELRQGQVIPVFTDWWAIHIVRLTQIRLFLKSVPTAAPLPPPTNQVFSCNLTYSNYVLTTYSCLYLLICKMFGQYLWGKSPDRHQYYWKGRAETQWKTYSFNRIPMRITLSEWLINVRKTIM